MSFPKPFDDGTASEAGSTASGVFDDGDVLYEEQVAPEHGVLGFTVRELIVVGVWLVAFVTSFFPVLVPSGDSVWQGIQWLLPIGVPTVAVFLIVLRRFSPDGIRRVGSLGIDQFASVAFSVAAVYWAQVIWELLADAIATGAILHAWVPWVQLVAMLCLVVASVFAFLVPGLREDFHGRLETLAHRNANPVRPVIARPRAPKPDPIVDAAHAPAGESGPVAAEALGDASAGLDVELSGVQSTDEIARLDLSRQIPLSAHASGGDVGTAPVVGTASAVGEEEYVPGYARRSRRTAEEAGDVVEQEAAVAEGEAVTEEAVAEEEASVVDDETGDRSGSADDASEAVEEPLGALEDVFEDVEDVSTRAVDIDATNPRTVPAAQPFWALAPTERDVVDEQGQAIFRIGPGAWALVIEDRGGAYVVRHDDGRIGYLHDIADITKG